MKNAGYVKVLFGIDVYWFLKGLWGVQISKSRKEQERTGVKDFDSHLSELRPNTRSKRISFNNKFL